MSLSRVRVVISAGVKKGPAAINFFSLSSSSGFRSRLKEVSGTDVLSVSQPANTAGAAIAPVASNLRDDLRSMSDRLEFLLFHLIDDVFRGTHAEGQDGPGNVLIGLTYKCATIHTKQVLAIVGLVPGIEG